MFDLRKIFDLRKFFAVPKNFLKSKIHCMHNFYDAFVLSCGLNAERFVLQETCLSLKIRDL